ncbi:Bro-N domain-containing protein [Pseudochrobactrum sp. XF203]|uniref:BRO-N domain-containing protein n=1 Tax=Pseudochrobactrum sp. XF203 TaxID=2879116 RepID=UPI00351D2783
MAVDLYDLLYGKRTGLNTAKVLSATEIRVVRRHPKLPSDFKSLAHVFAGTKVSHYALISESGLYKLIMRSDKPEARGFQNWVTREVLPTIRKTGSYSVNKESTQPPASCGAEAFFHRLYTDVNRSA